MWLNILSLDIMLRRRLNVSCFFIFWPQGKKCLLKRGRSEFLVAKAPVIFPPKTGTDFFCFHFFQNALSCERKWFHQATTTDIPNLKSKPKFLPNFTVSIESARNMRQRNLVLFCGMGCLLKLRPFLGDKPCHSLSFGTMHETFLGTMPWRAWKQNSSSGD